MIIKNNPFVYIPVTQEQIIHVCSIKHVQYLHIYRTEEIYF